MNVDDPAGWVNASPKEHPQVPKADRLLTTLRAIIRRKSRQRPCTESRALALRLGSIPIWSERFFVDADGRVSGRQVFGVGVHSTGVVREGMQHRQSRREKMEGRGDKAGGGACLSRSPTPPPRLRPEENCPPC